MRAGARDRADGRLARRCRCGGRTRRASPRRSCSGGRRRGGRGARGTHRGRGEPGDRGGCRGGRPRDLGVAGRPRRAADVPGLAGVLQLTRRLPAGPPAVRRPSAGRSRPPARDTRASRPRGRDRLAGLPPVPVRPRPVRERRDDRRDGEQRSRRGAPEHGRPRVAGDARAGVRRAGARPARAPRTSLLRSACLLLLRFLRRPASRCAWPTSSRRWPTASPAMRS